MSLNVVPFSVVWMLGYSMNSLNRRTQPEHTENQAIMTWAMEREFDSVHIDCATSLMLKILDGKCKMNEDEKKVMAVIYDVVKDKAGKLLDPRVHQLIALARIERNEDLIEKIYEQRLYAEQMISRPVMKAYKAMLREQGILAQ